MNLNNVVKSFVVFLGTLFFISCAPLKPIQFLSVTDLEVENVLASPTVKANINLYNPNSVGGTIRDFQLDVSLGGTQLTTLSVQKQRMPSNKTFSVPLDVSIPYSQLVKFIPLSLTSIQGGKDIQVELKGTVTIKKFLLKKTFPLEYQDKISTKDIQIK